MDNVSLVLFIVLVILAGIFAKPRRYWLTCLIGMLIVLGACEIWAKQATGLTLSQQQDGFHGWRAWAFNIALFGAFAALFIHLNWKRMRKQ